MKALVESIMTQKINQSNFNPNRLIVKVKHNGELKRFSQNLDSLSYKDLCYNILVSFKYIQDSESKFDPYASMSHQNMTQSEPNQEDKFKILDNFMLDLICSNSTDQDLALLSDQQSFQTLAVKCLQNNQSMQLTALVSFNQNLNNSSVAQSIIKHQKLRNQVEETPVIPAEIENEELPKLPEQDEDDFVILEDPKQEDLQPKLMSKSESRQVGSEFEHLHPRMIYEIINHIKFQGQINSTEIIEILSKFSDINNKDEMPKTNEQTIKYMSYSLEALKETVGRHQQNRFDHQQNSLEGKQLSETEPPNLELMTDTAVNLAISLPGANLPVVSPRPDSTNSDRLSYLKEIQNRLKASQMERKSGHLSSGAFNSQDQIKPRAERSILDSTAISQSIYEPVDKQITQKSQETHQDTDHTTNGSESKIYSTPQGPENM